MSTNSVPQTAFIRQLCKFSAFLIHSIWCHLAYTHRVGRIRHNLAGYARPRVVGPLGLLNKAVGLIKKEVIL